MGNISSASVVAALARLLKNIYEVDPLRCTHCGSEMHIIAWMEQSEVIRKILRHLDLWERPQRSPPPKLFPHKLRNRYGFSLSPAGPRNPSLHRFGFLGRCPGLERLKSQGSSAVIQYPCAFFSLFSHSFLPHLLSHNLRAGSACYSHCPAPK